MKLKLIASLAMLLMGALAPVQLNAQTNYNLTVKAGPLRQSFAGFGASQASTRWDQINATARNTMADMVYRDLGMNVLRLWVSCAPGKTVNDMVNELNTNYIASGAITDITSRGVSTLLLAPAASGTAIPASIPTYADNIAETILRLRDTYGVTIDVTGISNEPGAWTNAAVVSCVKELRARLDSRGLTSVKIIASEASSPTAGAVQARGLSNDPDAWAALYAIASHSYISLMVNDGMEVLKQDLKWWMTEASDGGIELAEDEDRGSSIVARFLCELNHSVDEWIFFIGLGQTSDITGYAGSSAYMMLYDIKTASVIPLLKYYYFKQALGTLEPGAIMRRTLSATEADMLCLNQQNPAISAAAGYNTDGSWGINIVNETGLTGSPASPPTNLFYSATTYNVTVTVEELASTPSMVFNVHRTSANNHVVASGTVTLSYGVGTVTVAPKELVSLRSGSTAAAVPPVPSGLVASTLNAPVNLIWNNTVKATSWNVKRATVSGGPYTTIATTDDTRYDDNTAANGTVYYYVVSAVNATGESANSAEVVASPTPFPWTNADIGAAGASGSCVILDSGLFQIYGAGASIGGAVDSFNYTYQTMTGNGTLIARLAKPSGANTKVGIMMCENLGTAPKAVSLVYNFNGTWNQVMFNKRATEGAGGSWSGSNVKTVPVWLKLIRAGNVFTGYASTDGTSWTSISSGTIAMADTIYAGMAVCACSTAATILGTFDNISAPSAAPTGLRQISVAPGQVILNWTASLGAASYNIKRATSPGGAYTTIGTATAPALTYTDNTIAAGTNYYYVVSAVNSQGESANSAECQAWNNSNVGTVGLSSSCTMSSGTFTAMATGTSLGGTVDSFNMTYRMLTGDGTLVARIRSSNRANSKAGIIMTESLGTAPKAASLIYNFNGAWNRVMMNKRTTEGTYGAWTGSSFTTVPVWLKLTRAGNVFTGYASNDGTNWTSISSGTISMGSTIYIGLVDCCSSNSVYCTAVFDSVTAP